MSSGFPEAAAKDRIDVGAEFCRECLERNPIPAASPPAGGAAVFSILWPLELKGLVSSNDYHAKSANGNASAAADEWKRASHEISRPHEQPF